MGYLQARELLTQVYKTVFGIYDYAAQEQKEANAISLDQKHPLSAVEMHPAELNSGSDQEYERVTRAFVDLKMNQYFGISWNDFMALPVERVELLLRIAKEANGAANTVQSKVLSELSAVSDGMK